MIQDLKDTVTTQLEILNNEVDELRGTDRLRDIINTLNIKREQINKKIQECGNMPEKSKEELANILNTI